MCLLVVDPDSDCVEFGKSWQFKFFKLQGLLTDEGSLLISLRKLYARTHLKPDLHMWQVVKL